MITATRPAGSFSSHHSRILLASTLFALLVGYSSPASTQPVAPKPTGSAKPVSAATEQRTAVLNPDSAALSKAKARMAELEASILRLHGEGRDTEAIKPATEAVKIAKEVVGAKHLEYAQCIGNLAFLYEATGNYTRAVPLYVEKCDILKEVLGPKHLDYALNLLDLADLYKDTGDYARAESSYVEVGAIVKETLGAKHPYYATSRNALAVLYVSMKDRARAEPLFIEALKIRKEALGMKNPDYAMSVNNLAVLYMNGEENARAEPLFVEALKIRKEVLGAKHPDCATTMNDLASLYDKLGEYARAESLYLEVLAIRKEVLGAKHPDYAQSLDKLADLCVDTGSYARAETLYIEALKIRKEALGTKHPDYVRSLSNLAGLYQHIGDYAQAEPLHVEALKIKKEVLGPKHRDYATGLNGLALLYASSGNYARAEPLYVEAVKIHREVLGAKHPDYATSLSNLASLYGDTADYPRAEPLLIEALKIRKEVLGAKHRAYAQSLNNLALHYVSMGDFARAEPYYVEALKIHKEVLGARHSDYATSLNNLAGLYLNMGDAARAEPLYVETVKIKKDVLGAKHPQFALSLSNLAGVYYGLGEFARAEPLFVEALKILKDVFGPKHPESAKVLSILAGLYVRMEDPARAEPLFREALGISRASLEATALVQSERQQLEMGKLFRYQLDAYVSLGANDLRYARSVFAQVLVWKGATLVRQRGMRLAADDPAVRDLFTQLQSTATQLASFSRGVPAQEAEQAAWRKKLTDLTDEKERLEAELSARSATFRQATKAITLDDLLAALPKGAVLVDYLEFERTTPLQNKGIEASTTRQLVAFVIKHAERPEDQVRMIPLGKVEPLKTAIDAWRITFGMDRSGTAAGQTIRAAVWLPLVEHVAAAKTILISTDGVLGRLPLGALPGKEPGTYLLEDHRLAVLPVPQLLPTLVNAEGKREFSKELLLLGDVDYDAAPEDFIGAATQKQSRQPGWNRSPADSKHFEPLAGAAGEIVAVEKLYGQLFEVKTDDPRTLIKAQADEARFRMLAPQYRHIHLATHGFFAGEQFQSGESSAAAPAAPFTGIGAALQATDGKTKVEALIYGGAAAADGRLKPGDEIRKVGEATGELVDIAGKELTETVKLLRGAAGTKVRIEVFPLRGKAVIVYELTRQVVPQAGVAASEATSIQQSISAPQIKAISHNPGLLSGLALTGANLAPSASGDDGILTAQEIGVMDLSGVDTVVLSACDTGLGETAGGEGLLGVQRAFQTAGARTTVASFWKVDDLVTRVLMERFYRNLWEKKMSRLDALREAQLWVLRNPSEVVAATTRAPGAAKPLPDGSKSVRAAPTNTIGTRSPIRLWAAFSISGDWR